MQAEAAPAALPTRLAQATLDLSERYWRFVVIAMLALLHVVTLRGVADEWARALMLAHLGLLLLWQPFLRGEQRVTATQGAVILLAALAVMLRLDWWLLAFWVVVLSGLVAGKVYRQDARWQRRFYLVVLGYLLALLTVVVLPEIAPRREITQEVRELAAYGLPALLVAAALFPAEPESRESAQVIDFFYSVFVILLLAVLVLGSFAFMTLGRTPYLESLTYTMFIVSGTVLLIGLAWNPRTGFAGLNVFFSRYLMSIGLPIEQWLFFLAALSRAEARPERYLEQAVAGLARLPWVEGAAWRAPAHGEGEAGVRTPHEVRFENESLALTIWSRYRLSPALDWHLRLLGQLLGEFYLAKLREQKLREQSYLQAVHETGARMTHDMKNLLQSLNVLCSVAAREDAGDSRELQALVRRQLPAIAERLAGALERLQRPALDEESTVRADEWWSALTRQYRDEGVEFEAHGLRPGIKLPKSLFDSVADNLIRNALAKRAADRALRVRVSLECDHGVALRVEDSGGAIADELATRLLAEPVRSANGLGIGLYQAARLAESRGYRLALEANRAGAVRFGLTGPAG